MIKPLLAYRGALPENPVWCERTSSLYWTDIPRKQLHSFHLQTENHQIIQYEEEVGSFALRESGGFILAMRSGIYLADAVGKVVGKVCDNPNDPSLSRFNDGCVDQEGAFYSGTYWERRNGFNAALMVRIDPACKAKVVQCDLLGSNGLAFTRDNKQVFFSDTPNYTIYRASFEKEKAQFSPREVYAAFPREKTSGRPDGAAIDVEGCYWTAMFEGGRVLRLSPTGEVLQEISLPVPFPTMISFGGVDMKTMFITTASQNMSTEDLEKYPLSGCILTMPAPVAGLIKPRFAG